MSLPAEDLKARVLSATKEARVPLRRTVRLRIAFLLAAIVLVVFGALEAEGGIHWDGRPRWFIIGTGIGWAGIALMATWLGARRGRSMVGRPKALLWAAAVGTPLLLFAWSLLWNFLYPPTFQQCVDSSGLPRVGLKCLDLVLSTASLPLLALGLWRARLDPTHPGATGAALGAAMGAWAGFTIDLSCECTNPSHVLIGHVSPVMLLTLAGYILGRRLRWRASP
jgi:hypothetical protein